MPRAVPLVVLLLLAIGIGLGFCVPRTGRSAAAADWPATIAGRDQGHVYTGVTEEPESVNPFKVAGGAAMRYVLGFTHDGLFDTDPVTGELRGALAESWQMDPDGLAFTCTLRPGVRFADGSAVTAEDVMFTWEVARGEPDLLGLIGNGMRMVCAAEMLPGGPMRLRVRLRQRHFDALRVVGESWLVVQARFFRDRIAELARADAIAPPAPDEPRFAEFLARVTASGPGTGPYQIGRDRDGNLLWRRHEDLLLVRNPDSWCRQVRPGTWNFAGIRLRFLGDTAGLAELHLHHLDWYSNPGKDPDQLLLQPDLAAGYRKVVYDYLNLGFLAMEWNARRPGLDRAEVRTALNMLFDRQGIADKIMAGNGVPASCFFKRTTPFYSDDIAPLPYDPAKARAMLRDAGFDPQQGRPFPSLKLFAPAELRFYGQVLETYADVLHAAGIEAQVQTLPWATIAALGAEGGDWDGICLGYNHAVSTDPYELFHSGGGQNWMGFSDAEVDDLVNRIRVELDAPARADLCHRLNHRLHELQPVAFLVHPLVALLYNRDIRGAEKPGPLGLWPENFWVPRDRQRR